MAVYLTSVYVCVYACVTLSVCLQVLEAEYERTTSFGEQLLKAISNFFSDKFFAFSWGPCNVSGISLSLCMCGLCM